jgi:hypothetical protein
MFAAPPDNNGVDMDTFFIPVALDPSPAPITSPRSTSETIPDPSRKQEKDYFNIPKAAATGDRKSDSQASTPHIAFQEKGRKTSSEHEKSTTEKVTRRLSKSSRSEKNIPPKASPAAADERGQKEFKLQDAPKSKKLVSSRSPSQASNNVENGTPKGSNGLPRKETTSNGSEPEKMASPRASQDTRFKESEGARRSVESASDAGKTDVTPKTIARKQLPPTAASRNGMSIFNCLLAFSAPSLIDDSKRQAGHRSCRNKDCRL